MVTGNVLEQWLIFIITLQLGSVSGLITVGLLHSKSNLDLSPARWLSIGGNWPCLIITWTTAFGIQAHCKCLDTFWYVGFAGHSKLQRNAATKSKTADISFYREKGPADTHYIKSLRYKWYRHNSGERRWRSLCQLGGRWLEFQEWSRRRRDFWSQIQLDETLVESSCAMRSRLNNSEHTCAHSLI